MKPSQRKVQFGSILRKLFKKQDEIKVAQLSGFISEKTSYHHGEVSLQGTIVGMAQNFVGANNINLLHPSGQFGTRLLGGKDAASSRYIFTYLAEWNRLIFRPEDDPILTYLNDDGASIEPEYYVPIIPMILVNGAQGIGTGFSTTVLQYNPIQIIDNLILMMEKKAVKEMYPWFRGFKGKVEKVDNGFNMKGIYKLDKENSKVIITELPIGTWTTVYKEYLDKLEEDKVIKGYKANISDETIYFEIQFTDDNLYDLIEKKKLESTLKLVNKETITNMHCFNKKSVINKYENIYNILKEFYDVRLEYYKKRKEYQINELEKELNILDWKMKFIKGVIDNTIIVNNQTKDKISQQLVDLEFPKLSENKSYDYLLTMPIYSLSKEKIDELQKKIDNLEEELETIEGTTEIQRWKIELGELKKVIEKIYKTDEKENDGKVKVFIK
jgi:DNA topoisomerase-2